MDTVPIAVPARRSRAVSTTSPHDQPLVSPVEMPSYSSQLKGWTGTDSLDDSESSAAFSGVAGAAGAAPSTSKEKRLSNPIKVPPQQAVAGSPDDGASGATATSATGSSNGGAGAGTAAGGTLKQRTTKAERRAIQEAQRAKKAELQGKKPQPTATQPAKKGGAAPGGAGGAGGVSGSGASAAAVSVPTSSSAAASSTAANLAVVPSGTGGAGVGAAGATGAASRLGTRSGAQEKLPVHHIDMFSHLDPHLKVTSKSLDAESLSALHPAVLRLGLKYAAGTITGSNARAVALLATFRQVINDYVTPPQKLLHRDLEISIRPYIAFLKRCRPMAVSMANVINYLKMHIAQTDGMAEDEAKQYLCHQIDTFLEERVIAADKLIAQHGSSKIHDGDVILTHASSHVVEMILKKAYDDGKRFRVIVADSRPMHEGKQLLRRLVRYGLECTYISINALSHSVKEATKVFIGAYALLANGNVVSRAGTAGVAMMAHYSNVPVLVCCETFKFCDRAQLDAICFNELGDPEALTEDHECHADKPDPNLRVLNVVYDLTPMEFVVMVVSEVGMIPPTSVPVVIREYHRDLPTTVTQ